MGTDVATHRVSTVYIVDADEAVRDSLVALLEAGGYTTRAFSSHEAFSGVYRPGAKACLLLDLRLPRCGGEDMLEDLSEMARRLPVIVMSGSARNMKCRALRAGAAAFVEKPLDSEELFCVLQKLFP